MKAAIIGAIIQAVATLASTAASTAVTLSGKEKFTGDLPQKSMNKYTFLNGRLELITEELKKFEDKINKEQESELEPLFNQLGEQKLKELKEAIINMNGTLGSVNSKLHANSTEEQLAVYFSYFFKLIDQIEDYLLWDNEVRAFFSTKLNQDFSGLENIVKKVNEKYPPMWSDFNVIRVINTFESNPKHNNQDTYLIGGGGWNAWTWTYEGGVNINDLYWSIHTLSSDKFKNWILPFHSWVDFTDRVRVELVRDRNACLVKGGAGNRWVRQGSEKNENYAQWIIEDIADKDMNRRVRMDDWFALRSCADNRSYMSAIKQVSGTPQGIACTHPHPRYYQEAKDPGTDNVEFDGIWKIVR